MATHHDQPNRDALELMARNRPGSIVGLKGKVDWMVSPQTPADQEIEVVPPAEEPEEMPLPSDPKDIFLGGLFVLALLATAYVASEIVMPLVFAIILKLLLSRPCAYWSACTYRGYSRRCC